MVLKEGRRRACSRAIWESEVRHDDCLSTDLPVLEILSDDSTLCHKKKSAETASTSLENLVRRSELENEVLVLLQELQQEVELHQVLEQALAHKNGSNSARPPVPCDLPVNVQTLLSDISRLEVFVLELEVQTAAIQWELVREQTERELIQHNLEHPLDITTVVSTTSQTPAAPLISSQQHPSNPCVHATPKKLTSSPSTKAAVITSSMSPSPAPTNSSTVTTEPPAPPAVVPQQKPYPTTTPVAKDPPQPELQNSAVPLLCKSPRPSLQSLWQGVESVPQSYLRPIPRKENWRTFTNPSAQVAKPSPSPSPNPKYGNDEMMLSPTRTPSSPDSKPQSVSYFKNSLPTFTPVENPLPTSPVSPVKHGVHVAPTAKDSTRAKSTSRPESLDCLTTSDDEEDGEEKGEAEVDEEEDIASSVRRSSFEFVQQQPSSPLRQSSRSMEQDLLTDEENTEVQTDVKMMLELRSHGAGSERITNTITSHSENSSPKSSSTTQADDEDDDDDNDSTSWKHTKSFSDRIAHPPHSKAQPRRTTSSRSPRRCKIDIDSGLMLASQLVEKNSSFSSPQHASCRLSEEMVRRMMDIYCHLAEPSGDPHSSPECPLSPSSHGTRLSSNSLSSTSSSESSDSNPNSSPPPMMVMSLLEDPIGCDSSPDPYKAMGKLPWADIGPYGTAFEVPWLSVGKEQLGYVANALAEFRVLVKQLANVNPSEMSHEQKLAFWINLYNSLLMHAFLAYGIPRTDLKFFTLMQKAAYCVGGHWFNAAVIEHCLLKGKVVSHRPQFALMMALQNKKLTEEQNNYGIDRVEPEVNFALSCGTRSSPMVRIYTPKRIHEELQSAFQDYLRASVGMNAKGKFLVPELVYNYARNFVDDKSLIDWVCQFLPTAQVVVLYENLQQRQRRQSRLIRTRSNFTVIPFNSTLRYLFPSGSSSLKSPQGSSSCSMKRWFAPYV